MSNLRESQEGFISNLNQTRESDKMSLLSVEEEDKEDNSFNKNRLDSDQDRIGRHMSLGGPSED